MRLYLRAQSRDLDIMPVQYHPEAHPVPLDTEKIYFDRVVGTMKNMKVGHYIQSRSRIASTTRLTATT